MSKRRKLKRYISKYEDDAVLITSTILSFECRNEEIGEKFKNVFYIKSKQYPEQGRMCVFWGICRANIGDEVECKGRINDQGTFLCWSIMIKKTGQLSV